MAQTAQDTRFRAQHERILKAAARCFNEKGHSGTSLKDVARLLGLDDEEPVGVRSEIDRREARHAPPNRPIPR